MVRSGASFTWALVIESMIDRPIGGFAIVHVSRSTSARML